MLALSPSNHDQNLQENYLDTPWCELTVDEKSHTQFRERLAINIARDTKQPLPIFLNKNGPSRFLSINAALVGEKPPIPSKKSKARTKSRKDVESDPDQSSSHPSLKLVVQSTDSDEGQSSTSGRLEWESKETKSDLDKMSISGLAEALAKKRGQAPSKKRREPASKRLCPTVHITRDTPLKLASLD